MSFSPEKKRRTWKFRRKKEAKEGENSHQTRTVAARGTSEGPSGSTGWPAQPLRGQAP